MKKLFTIFMAVATAITFAQVPKTESVLVTNNTWKFTAQTQTDWQKVGFNDASWTNAVESNHLASNYFASDVLSPNTKNIWTSGTSTSPAYFRKTFSLVSVNNILSAKFTMSVDDAAEIYINGNLVGGYGFGTSTTVDFKQYLVSGANLIAVITADNSNGAASSFWGELKTEVSCITTSTTAQIACGSYTWNGTTYTTSGTYTKTGLKNKAGCDSTATLNLTIKQPSTSTTTQSACGSYTWNGTTYTSSGTYTKTGLKNKAGCDSTATLNLTIKQPSTSTTTQSACVSYTWNGTTYTTSGTYTKTGLKNKAGCDSTASLNLTIKQPSTSTTTQSACGSYTWNGTTYTSSGTYTKTGLKNKAGCDSTATLNLTIKQPSTSTTTQSACVSYTWNGTTYTTSGTYTKTGLKNKAGCDSSATLNLTIKQPSTSSTTQSACVSYTWNGTTYTASGTYTKTGLKNKAGCDSTATLNLTIKQPSTSSTTQSACVSYTWNGTTYTSSGTYTKTGLKNKAGCDSTATLNLTINQLPSVNISNLPSYININASNITLAETPTGGTFSGKGVSSGVFNPKTAGLGSKTITYTATNTNGCSNTATQKTTVFDTTGTFCSVKDTLYIKTTVVTGTSEGTVENTMKIYPNPASDHLIIENNHVTAMSGHSVQVLDMQGKTVFSSPINQSQFSISLTNWTKNSLYVLKLLDAQNAVVETRKVIVQ